MAMLFTKLQKGLLFDVWGCEIVAVISLVTEITEMKPNAIVVLDNMQFDAQITAVCQEGPCKEFAWTCNVGFFLLFCFNWKERDSHRIGRVT